MNKVTAVVFTAVFTNMDFTISKVIGFRFLSSLKVIPTILFLIFLMEK